MPPRTHHDKIYVSTKQGHDRDKKFHGKFYNCNAEKNIKNKDKR
jgi:hypothetical protein